MNTTLTRTVDTIRNLLLNFDHYAGGPGVADLKDAARRLVGRGNELGALPGPGVAAKRAATHLSLFSARNAPEA